VEAEMENMIRLSNENKLGVNMLIANEMVFRTANPLHFIPTRVVENN
jgi:hypothetical protein